jgi:tetratricopeptide (TPR) repeat protein
VPSLTAPSHALAHAFVCAHLHLQHVRRDIDGAESAYREAIRLAPTNSDAHCNLGYLLQHERHDAAGAEACYKNAIAFNADSLLAHYNMAFLQEKELNNLEVAEREYAEALRIDPKDADAQCRLVKVQVARAHAVGVVTAQTAGTAAPSPPPPANQA